MKQHNHKKYTDNFKIKNPDYFKNYYKNNKHKYNQHSNKSQWYAVEIFGTLYVFNRKSDIKIKSIGKNELNNTNVVRVKV